MMRCFIAQWLREEDIKAPWPVTIAKVPTFRLLAPTSHVLSQTNVCTVQRLPTGAHVFAQGPAAIPDEQPPGTQPRGQAVDAPGMVRRCRCRCRCQMGAHTTAVVHVHRTCTCMYANCAS